MTDQLGSEQLKNDQHELFCNEYLKDLNVKQAAIRAGYSERSAGQHGHDIYKRTEVQARIDHLKQDRMNSLGLDVYYVLKNLKTIADRCMQAEEVTDREGNPVLMEDANGDLKPVYRFDAQGATKASELIGKHIGMFVEQKKINVEVDLMSELIDEISDE
ncbi:phage terminase small subunit [Acinetobacter calcoaceticus]|uniref:Phage terminase small subunit n=1 Tax=Acinetobacter calcoaceticus TaxID=471 RepID=A0A4V2QZV6_ACICA|nr:phage terminase small subunit [Acinetobacter calcoaceticus]